jgi:hypothetical protein
VNIVGYDPDGLTCITWGKRQRMTWAFWHAYVDEAWAILPAEFNGATIAGLHWDQLQADLALVGRVRR